jgi:hypothetical protein
MSIERHMTVARNGRRLLLWAALATSGVFASCREDEPEVDVSSETRELSTFELGRVGGRIYNEPDRVNEILEEVGLTPEQFEQKVRSVTNDPELSREYTRGFEKVARPPVQPQDTSDTAGASAVTGGS